MLALFIVIINVIIHANVIFWLRNIKRNIFRLKQARTITVILFLILSLIIEIAVFAIGYQLMLLNPDFGTLDGLEQSGFTDYLYFSAVVFTTLGFGDIVPLGYIRLYVSIEALTGLSLIAWSMSSAFEEFQRYES
ncbi:potassium channel family protein [Vibrio sp. Isolate22]|uniref:potassium channel family protein n=1 Tax=Vibrio sp. Isolate22 TaxID=2908532 RepID=UPI0023D94935|nr:potassium channel family protein [Vibrio sp. Isolate22]